MSRDLEAMGLQPAPPCFYTGEASSFIRVINGLPWVLPSAGLEEDPGEGLRNTFSSRPAVTCGQLEPQSLATHS